MSEYLALAFQMLEVGPQELHGVGLLPLALVVRVYVRDEERLDATHGLQSGVGGRVAEVVEGPGDAGIVTELLVEPLVALVDVHEHFLVVGAHVLV